MPQYFLRYILATGIAGSIAAVCVLAVLPIIKRAFASAWLYRILISTAVLFLLPVSFALIDFVFVTNPGGADHTAFYTSYAAYSAYTAYLRSVQTYGRNLLTSSGNIIRYAAVIWAGGFIVFTANKAREYAIFYKKILKNNKPLYDESLFGLFAEIKTELKIKKPLRLFVNPNISSPMIVCMFKPAVLIPDITLSDAEWRFVFLHELTHYKRRDLWLFKFAMMACAIHWFNPFAYVIYSNIRAACEFSCDEAVLKRIKPSERKQYGMAILNMLDYGAGKSAFASALSGCGKRAAQRLKLIARGNLSRKGFVLPIAVIVFIACLSLLPAAVVSGVTVYDGAPPAAAETTKAKTPKATISLAVWTYADNGEKYYIRVSSGTTIEELRQNLNDIKKSWSFRTAVKGNAVGITVYSDTGDGLFLDDGITVSVKDE